MLEHPWIAEPLSADESISLKHSMIGQPFEMPSSVGEMDDKNSVKFNVNESILFNDEIAKQMQKHFSEEDAKFEQ